MKKLPSLVAMKRELFGRKVKALRRDGNLPANIYGKKLASIAVQVPLKDFQKTFEEVGETGVIELQVNDDKYPALIHNVQVNPVTDIPVHVDFLNVDLAQKVTAPVPIEFIGESPAEKSGEGVVVYQLYEVEVEALPTDLPEKLEVDVSGLEKIDDAIHVSDLNVDRAKIEIKEDPEQSVVYITEPQKEEEIAPPEEAVAEGEAPAEGETKEGEAEGEEKPAEGEPTSAQESSGEAKKE